MSEPLRRLPVYILIDCSGGMHGEPIEAVRRGLRALVEDFQSDPQALELLYLSVITFAGSAVQACPLRQLAVFQTPNLIAGGPRALGEALDLLGQCIDLEVRKPEKDQKGDWKALVILLLYGIPQDDWVGALARYKEATAKRVGSFIAIGCGSDVDLAMLEEITPSVVLLKRVTPDWFRSFGLHWSISPPWPMVGQIHDGPGLHLAQPQGVSSVP